MYAIFIGDLECKRFGRFESSLDAELALAKSTRIFPISDYIIRRVDDDQRSLRALDYRLENEEHYFEMQQRMRRD